MYVADSLTDCRPSGGPAAGPVAVSSPVWAGPQGGLLLVFEFKVLVLATALVVLILSSREFRSQVRQVLRS